MSIAVVFNGMASERSDERLSCYRTQNDTCNSPRQSPITQQCAHLRHEGDKPRAQ